MQKEFWLSRWQNNEIGFHNHDVNPLLVAHLERLALPDKPRLLLPLCGKSRDIAWLLANNIDVVGIELSALAVEQLFDELNLTPVVEIMANGKVFRTDNLMIYVADIFDLTADDIGPVDAIYDRAALVALPPTMRMNYADQLARISHVAPQLLISFDYDQTQMPGPPFSVPENELQLLYGKRYRLQPLASAPLPGGLKGQCAAFEQVWLLQPNG